MNLSVCKKICQECPFSKFAIQGWLGSHTLQGVLNAQQNEKLFSCHMRRKDGMTNADIISGDVEICRGYLVCASKSGITFGNDSDSGEEAKALGELQQFVNDQGVEDKDTILSTEEFVAYHGKPKLPDSIRLSQEEMDRRRGFKR